MPRARPYAELALGAGRRLQPWQARFDVQTTAAVVRRQAHKQHGEE